MNVLLVTSCNRIKQVILATTINALLIKEQFHLVVVDNSTTTIPVEAGALLHAQQAYNHITQANYCADISLFDKHLSLLPNVSEYKLIHVSPRLDKQEGEASLITLGLAQAAILKDADFCLKLSGVAILRQEIFKELPGLLEQFDVVASHRSYFNQGELATRWFGCRPAAMLVVMAEAGWSTWVNKHHDVDLEHKFAKLARTLRLNYLLLGEHCLLDEGKGWAPQRKAISHLLATAQLPTNLPIIQEFLDGGIYEA